MTRENSLTSIFRRLHLRPPGCTYALPGADRRVRRGCSRHTSRAVDNWRETVAQCAHPRASLKFRNTRPSATSGRVSSTVHRPDCGRANGDQRLPSSAADASPKADRSTGMPLGSCLPFQVTPGGDGLFVRRQSVHVSCIDVCLASSDAPLVLWAFIDQEDLNLIQDLTRSSRPQNAYQ